LKQVDPVFKKEVEAFTIAPSFINPSFLLAKTHGLPLSLHHLARNTIIKNQAKEKVSELLIQNTID
jgi:hypothetical protein